MRRLVLLLLLLPAIACAVPDRAGLINAWEAAMRRDGTLDAQADGSYRYRNDALGYDGGMKIVSAIVRKESTERTDGIPVSGSVDFDLPDLPITPGSPSMGLMSWKAERQNYVYDSGRQAWLSTVEWANARYHREGWLSLSFLLTNVVPIGLILLFGAVLLMAIRIQWRASSRLAESGEVNRMARENIERTDQLREAQKAVTREMLDLARRNAATLDAILEELRRRG